jgi:hypothetical protein
MLTRVKSIATTIHCDNSLNVGDWAKSKSHFRPINPKLAGETFAAFQPPLIQE